MEGEFFASGMRSGRGGKGCQLIWTHSPRRSDPQPRIETGLRELQPLRLQLVEQEQQTRLWNEYVERHHYLGYRQPMGPHLPHT